MCLVVGFHVQRQENHKKGNFSLRSWQKYSNYGVGNKAVGGHQASAGKERGMSLHNQEIGFMWTLWHSGWFWGFSSLGPLCCKFNSMAGWDSPAQKSSQLLSPSANLSLSFAPGGWVLLKRKGISKATGSASVNGAFTKPNCVFMSVHQTEIYHLSVCPPPKERRREIGCLSKPLVSASGRLCCFSEIDN